MIGPACTRARRNRRRSNATRAVMTTSVSPMLLAEARDTNPQDTPNRSRRLIGPSWSAARNWSKPKIRAQFQLIWIDQRMFSSPAPYITSAAATAAAVQTETPMRRSSVVEHADHDHVRDDGAHEERCPPEAEHVEQDAIDDDDRRHEVLVVWGEDAVDVATVTACQHEPVVGDEPPSTAEPSDQHHGGQRHVVPEASARGRRCAPTHRARRPGSRLRRRSSIGSRWQARRPGPRRSPRDDARIPSSQGELPNEHRVSMTDATGVPGAGASSSPRPCHSPATSCRQTDPQRDTGDGRPDSNRQVGPDDVERERLFGRRRVDDQARRRPGAVVRRNVGRPRQADRVAPTEFDRWPVDCRGTGPARRPTTARTAAPARADRQLVREFGVERSGRPVGTAPASRASRATPGGRWRGRRVHSGARRWTAGREPGVVPWPRIVTFVLGDRAAQRRFIHQRRCVGMPTTSSARA